MPERVFNTEIRRSIRFYQVRSSSWCGMALAGFASGRSQNRGPNHDGRLADSILTEGPSAGPAELWRWPLTNGFSSIAVSQDRACPLETPGCLNDRTRQAINRSN